LACLPVLFEAFSPRLGQQNPAFWPQSGLKLVN
jgi:hypothetical protein